MCRWEKITASANKRTDRLGYEAITLQVAVVAMFSRELTIVCRRSGMVPQTTGCSRALMVLLETLNILNMYESTATSAILHTSIENVILNMIAAVLVYSNFSFPKTSNSTCDYSMLHDSRPGWMEDGISSSRIS